MPFLTIPGILCTFFGLILMAAFYASANDPTGRFHSFILGAILISGGLQLFLSGILIKVYSVIHGFERRVGFVEHLLNYHTLERYLFVGIVLTLMGLLIGSWILKSWISTGFGELAQIGNAVLSLLLIIIGLEVAFTTVFISMMCLNDETSP